MAILESAQIRGQLSAVGGMSGRVTVPTIIAPEAYTGQTVVIPSDVEQVLPTADYMMQSDIIVAPIPNNYGLITWDGSTLTVS